MFINKKKLWRYDCGGNSNSTGEWYIYYNFFLKESKKNNNIKKPKYREKKLYVSVEFFAQLKSDSLIFCVNAILINCTALHRFVEIAFRIATLQLAATAVAGKKPILPTNQSIHFIFPIKSIDTRKIVIITYKVPM